MALAPPSLIEERADAAELRASGLGRQIGGRWLYRDLNAFFAPATVTAIVGPNGSGKTTLLRDLAGLRRPAAGSVTLRGASLADRRPAERARALAYLPQTTPLAYDLPAHEVVMLGRSPFLPRFAGPSPADHQHVADALRRVGLAGAGERRVSSLSGGERQRVMLARLLATQAPLLLLDEPTASLDVGHALAFMDLCRALAATGTTVIAALHDLDLARSSADAAIVLGSEGGAAIAGTAASLLTPSVLGPIFAVELREIDGHLVFERSLQPSATRTPS